MDIIKSIEHEQLKNKIPDLRVGDTVKVHARVKEGNRERIQVFEGIIIKKQGGGVNETFTVRKTFLVHSPNVEKVEVTRVGKARRAKLYYLRDRVGKAAKTKEKIGARIETKEIIVKEEVVPGEADVVEEVTEVVPETVEAPVEEVKAETKAEEKIETKAEEKAEVKEEKKVEAKTEEKVEDKKEDKE